MITAILEYFAGLWHWAGAHPAVVFLLISFGAFLGLVLGGILAGAGDPAVSQSAPAEQDQFTVLFP